jgi:hypothetical protein
MRSEEMAHPRLVKAIHEMREALRELREAPDDFGGNNPGYGEGHPFVEKGALFPP